jgi:hypothetical protein
MRRQNAVEDKCHGGGFQRLLLSELRPRLDRPHDAAEQRPEPMKTGDARPSTNGRFRKGDIIVTAVAHHYAIGRIGANGRTQEHLGSEKDRTLALALACQFARAAHRVFLYQAAGDSTFALCDCQKIGSFRGTHVKT